MLHDLSRLVHDPDQWKDCWRRKFQETGKGIFPGIESEEINCLMGIYVGYKEEIPAVRALQYGNKLQGGLLLERSFFLSTF